MIPFKVKTIPELLILVVQQACGKEFGCTISVLEAELDLNIVMVYI